jgi:7-carboxy-7-deazaguanine synthase
MFGQNPKRPPEKGDGSTLQVVEIFPTLQGEGPFVGQPAVFVRLGGCNLACDFCDTEFEKFMAMGLDAIVQKILTLAARVDMGSPARFLRDLVVITGGEPLRQEIGPLCRELLACGLRVQIETNGTLWRQLPGSVHVICSPKVTDGRYHPLRPDLLARVDALKFIVAADSAEYGDVAEVGQSGRDIPVYVQPMDVGDAARNQANTAHAAMLAQARGYRLSLQMHKMLGIP